MNYYIRNNKDSDVYGPFPVEKLKSLLESGSISADFKATSAIGESIYEVYKQSQKDWWPITKVSGLEHVTRVAGLERISLPPPLAPEHFAVARRNANIGIGVGILLVVIGLVLMVVLPPLGLLVRLTGGGFYFWGCYNYAIAKGWNGWFGVFLGLTCIGILVMVLLPDKDAKPKRPV